MAATRSTGTVSPYQIKGRDVYLATFRDVKRRRQTKSLHTRDEGVARAICGCLQVYSQRDLQTTAEVPPEFAHPTALILYFGALDNPSVEVDEDGTTTVEAGALTGELPAYSHSGLEIHREEGLGLLKKHVSVPAARTRLIEIFKGLDQQRRQAGGYALAYAAKAADVTRRDQTIVKLRQEVGHLQTIVSEQERRLSCFPKRLIN